ncbi:hypothetical protein [Hoeflea prorocentri]|uniref:Secreted protein n=1 Tax=Hoeflea prorocentri TaxID=1922333 RepID=A0A9X3UJU2_9HYPH|nr:hypothetical protein [Hoeflea prorocentri]MCY6381937.1 hypothetical protein [Hoeflea prorocentri]MDA5399737.1 hypothetical protein [Hoeflea prorocentri]
MTYPTKNARFGGLFATMVVAATVLSVAPASAEYACKNGHHYKNGTGVNANLIAAQTYAKKQWQNKIKDEYGLAWSTWSIAKGKQVICSAGGGGSKICVARARPCKYVTG